MLMYDPTGANNLLLVPMSGLTATRTFTFPNESGTLYPWTSVAQPTNGQLLIGSTNNNPVQATLTAGTGINITNGAGSITIASSVGIGTGGFAYTAPPNPAGTAVVDPVFRMMGFGTVAGGNTVVTISSATRLLITVCGDVSNTTNNDGARMQIYYDDQAVNPAPANGAVPVGNPIGSKVEFQQTNNGVIIPFNLNAIATSLVPGHTYWIDVALAAENGGAASIHNVTISAIEF